MSRDVDVLAEALRSLLAGNDSEARRRIVEGYPFEPIPRRRAPISAVRAMCVFLGDGFVDRYSGDPLIFPGALKALSLRLPDVFPAHPNWKMSESHIAFWRHFATVDHVIPVARGGAHEESNFVTTSMLHNGMKANWLLEELGWELAEPGDLREWDGLLGTTLRLAQESPELLADRSFRNWHDAGRCALARLGSDSAPSRPA